MLLSGLIVHCISSSLSGLVKGKNSRGALFERKPSDSSAPLIGQFQRETRSSRHQQTDVVANVWMGFNLVIKA